jgi:hypothetical protein
VPWRSTKAPVGPPAPIVVIRTIASVDAAATDLDLVVVTAEPGTPEASVPSMIGALGPAVVRAMSSPPGGGHH